MADDQRAAADARATLEDVFKQIAAIEAELVPYEKIKSDLADARAKFRDLTNKFVEELRARCARLNDGEEQALVLELHAEDLWGGLDAAVGERKQSIARSIENLWNKYATTLTELTTERDRLSSGVREKCEELGYVH